MGIVIINQSLAVNKLKSLGEDFVLIENPEFVHPEFEIVPLAKKIYKPERLVAAVMDMDGTTTTTEELCIESLELMIRKMSGLMTEEHWEGLTYKDYPNIIGNSTTKHIEYLITSYSHLIDKTETIKSFVEAIIWTYQDGKSEQRKKEVLDLLKSFDLLDKFQNAVNSSGINFIKTSNEFINSIKKKINLESSTELVKIGIEIYYQNYHHYLQTLNQRHLTISKKKLIEPLPGVAIFLALVKGFLGEEAPNLSEKLIEEFHRKNSEIKQDFDKQSVEENLRHLGIYFQKYPLKVAVVTSSIFYEADIVLSEVFEFIKNEIEDWSLSERRKKQILERFISYQNFYDAIVTATDAYEFRLKPHRDLYSIALYRLGIPKNDFDKVIGFEDSQSGTVAIRAAGIGCCIAVPFTQTQGHNLEAASHIMWNGLPEFILKQNCLINFDRP